LCVLFPDLLISFLWQKGKSTYQAYHPILINPLPMQILDQLYTIVVVTCLLLIAYRDIFTSRFLKAVFILLLYSEIISLLLETTTATGIPLFIIITGYVTKLLFIPGAYLYLRNHFYQQQFERSDLIHLLPMAVFYTACIIAWLVNGSVGFVTNAGLNPVSSSSESAQFALLCFRLFTLCVAAFYLWQLLLLLRKNFTGIQKSKSDFNAADLVVEEPIQEKVNYINIQKNNGHNGSHSAGINGHSQEQKNGEVLSFFLTEEKMNQMDILVKELFIEKEPFLQQGYSLKYLSEELHVPLHHLSAFINRFHKMNFNDFINRYRVSHCEKKIINEEWKYKKLEAIACESGFSNRNTFTLAFKKVTGLNPSAYLKRLKKQPKYSGPSLSESKKTTTTEEEKKEEVL
jgi:AraC-like DNA-binding protein